MCSRNLVFSPVCMLWWGLDRSPPDFFARKSLRSPPETVPPLHFCLTNLAGLTTREENGYFSVIFMPLLSWWYQLMFDGKCCSLAAPRKPQFLQDMADMVACGLFTDVQVISNLFIRIATRYQGKN